MHGNEDSILVCNREVLVVLLNRRKGPEAPRWARQPCECMRYLRHQCTLATAFVERNITRTRHIEGD